MKLKNNGKNIINIICLVCYGGLLLYFTLIGRKHTNPLHAVFEGWLPFRRYDGTWNLDSIYNIFLLTPITFFISRVFSIKTKKDVFLRIVVLAFVISLFIEVNQLLFQVGTFQISDLVYNTLSGLIGYILYRILYKE